MARRAQKALAALAETMFLRQHSAASEGRQPQLSRLIRNIEADDKRTPLDAQRRALSSDVSTSGRRMSGTSVSYASLALTLATGTGLLYYFQRERERKLQVALSRTETAGKAAIGGPFQLIDHEGRAFSSRDLLGKFALLYFGFTHCPDICPEELEKMAAAVASLDEETRKAVQCVFITLDPERDSVAQVKQYTKEFSKDFIGLTGSSQQVKDAARAYRVYFTRTNDEEDYLIDHSIIMYLINPAGDFVTFYGKNFTKDTLADSLKSVLSRWKSTH